jgi:hypothetical protein
MATYPLINGVRHDFSSIEFTIKGAACLGVKEIAYSDSLEPGEVRGTSAQLLGRTRGQLKSEGSFTVPQQEWKELLDKLGNGFLEAVFDIVVNFREDGAMYTDKILGCRVKKADRSHSNNADALEVKVELSVMRIEWNGKDPIRNMRK